VTLKNPGVLGTCPVCPLVKTALSGGTLDLKVKCYAVQLLRPEQVEQFVCDRLILAHSSMQNSQYRDLANRPGLQSLLRPTRRSCLLVLPISVNTAILVYLDLPPPAVKIL